MDLVYLWCLCHEEQGPHPLPEEQASDHLYRHWTHHRHRHLSFSQNSILTLSNNAHIASWYHILDLGLDLHGWPRGARSRKDSLRAFWKQILCLESCAHWSHLSYRYINEYMFLSRCSISCCYTHRGWAFVLRHKLSPHHRIGSEIDSGGVSILGQELNV